MSAASSSKKSTNNATASTSKGKQPATQEEEEDGEGEEYSSENSDPIVDVGPFHYDAANPVAIKGAAILCAPVPLSVEFSERAAGTLADMGGTVENVTKKALNALSKADAGTPTRVATFTYYKVSLNAMLTTGADGSIVLNIGSTGAKKKKAAKSPSPSPKKSPLPEKKKKAHGGAAPMAN
jgi:hypothetical protein